MSLADRNRARALARLAEAAKTPAAAEPAAEDVKASRPRGAGLAARNRDRKAAAQLPPRAAAVAQALDAQAAPPAPSPEPASPPAAPPEDERARAYRMKLIELGEDRRRLKAIQSVAGKIELKRQLLPNYAPWVGGIIAAEAEGGVIEQDEIFTTVMIWRIDVGDFAGALPLAAYALRHKLKLPDRYARDVATTVAEEIANAVLKAMTAGEAVDLEALREAARITADHDMPDQVRAKLLKAQGLALMPAAKTQDEVSEALRYLTRAFALNEKIGVKKEIEALRRELVKLQTAPGGEPDAQTQTGGEPA